LKVPSVSDAVTLDGKVFQTRGAATKNARSPRDLVCRMISKQLAGKSCHPKQKCNESKRSFAQRLGLGV